MMSQISSLDDDKVPSRFMFYWIGQLFSLTGSEITQFAIIWWIAVEYESSFIYALGLVAGTITRLFMMPLIGIILDVENRKRVLILADFGQAVVTGVMVILFYLDNISLISILILLACRDIFQNIHESTNSVIVPQLVPKSMFSRLNGMNLLSYGISSFGGPIAGALLVEVFGQDQIEKIILIDIYTFIFAFIAISVLRIPLNLRDVGDTISFKQKLGFGINYLKNNRMLLALASLPMVGNFTLTTSHIIMPILVLSSESFNEGARGLGLAIAVQSIGFILGSLITSKWKIVDKFYFKKYLSYLAWIIGVIVTAGAIILVNFTILLIGQFLTGFWIAYTSAVAATIWQRLVPNVDLGKVVAIRRMISGGSYPLGLILAGFLSEFINPGMLVLGGAIIVLVYVILVFRLSALVHLDHQIGKN